MLTRRQLEQKIQSFAESCASWTWFALKCGAVFGTAYLWIDNLFFPWSQIQPGKSTPFNEEALGRIFLSFGSLFIVAWVFIDLKHRFRWWVISNPDAPIFKLPSKPTKAIASSGELSEAQESGQLSEVKYKPSWAE